MSMVFCRGCGKEIHDSAPTCPHCGAPQSATSSQGKTSFSSYDQVPWYRKNWFAIVCFFIFPLGLLAVLFIGDVYYERKGELKAYSKGTKIFLIIWGILFIAAAIHRG